LQCSFKFKNKDNSQLGNNLLKDSFLSILAAFSHFKLKKSEFYCYFSKKKAIFMIFSYLQPAKAILVTKQD